MEEIWMLADISSKIAFLALGIASAVSTVIAVKVVDAVNKYGNEIGVSAYRGNKFMAMTWAATAIMLLGSILWIIDCCVPRARRKQVTYVKEGKEGRLLEFCQEPFFTVCRHVCVTEGDVDGEWLGVFRIYIHDVCVI